LRFAPAGNHDPAQRCGNDHEIPYDYVAKFTLQGRPGNRVQDVINISIEGAFVAVAIGYSFIPASWDNLNLPTDTSNFLKRLAPLKAIEDPLMLAKCLLVRTCGIDFKYSIVDSGTGRELQNQPIHNIAGLGEQPVTSLYPLGRVSCPLHDPSRSETQWGSAFEPGQVWTLYRS
jgi:hypothetical protein